MNTKKLLVAFDEKKQKPRSGDFLTVVMEEGRPCLFGLRSKEFWESGCMVFVGKNITENDLFSKLVETGMRIENVGKSLSTIAAYLEKLQDFRIGNVLAINESSFIDNGEIQLIKLAQRPVVTGGKKLP